jgi:hypothetical protein
MVVQFAPEFSLSFLIFFIGVVGMRLVTIAIGIGLALLLEKHLGKLVPYLLN